MAEINASIPPGFLLDPAAVTFSFDDKTAQYAKTTGAVPPSISKYIAYDTLSPPKPFLAVTEDGRGRVVYDGGFPKFYNIASFNGATTFAGLNGACKFLHNALNWVKNAEKWSSGNKKILILSDNFDGDQYYNIKSTASNGFKNTLDMVAAIVGATTTYKTCSDWGGAAGKIDLRLAEMEQYCLIVFFGSYSGTVGSGPPSITAQSVNDMVTYRENGNGLIFITDDGPDTFTTAEQALAGAVPTAAGFYKTINRVVTRFGAWFSGNFNRSPVNVGFLRRTYGDHPLYDSMSDSEDIWAGGSESQIFITQQPLTPTTQNFTVQVANGTNIINVLMLKTSGEIISGRYTYIVAGNEIIFVNGKNQAGNPVVNGPIASDQTGALVDFSLSFDASQLGTIFAELLHNGVRVGDAMATETGTEFVLYAGAAGKPFRKGDNFSTKVVSPLLYEKKVDILGDEIVMGRRWDVVNKSARGFAKTNTKNPALYRALKSMTGLTNRTGLAKAASRFANTTVKQFKDGTGLDGGIQDVLIYESDAAVRAAIAANPKTYNVCYINAANGQAYAYASGSVVVIDGLKAHHIWAAPCTLRNGAKSWKLATNGSLTLV